MHNMIQIRKFRKINQKQKTQGWKIYEEKKSLTSVLWVKLN